MGKKGRHLTEWIQWSNNDQSHQVLVSKTNNCVKQIAPHCGWDLFCILVSNMILSKFFQHQIILNIWTSCNIFVLNYTLNFIIHLNFSNAKSYVDWNLDSYVHIDRFHTENQKLALNETLLSSVKLSSFIVTCFSSYSIFTGWLSVASKQLKL